MTAPGIDEAFVEYFEDAKAFLELAQKRQKVGDSRGADAFCRASLLVGFASFEAFLHSVSTDFVDSGHPDLSVHDKAFLSEKEVVLSVDGKFEVSDKTKFARMEERIVFLFRRLSGRHFDRTKSFWSTFLSGVKLRNDIVHPKTYQALRPSTVEQTLSAVLETMNYISKGIYKRKLPITALGLQAKHDLLG